MIKFLFFILSVLVSCSIYAKNVNVIVRHFNVTNGLSNNYIHGIVQDSRGRVWIATEAGLNCYDGYRFAIYKTYNSALRSNYINCICRDSVGRKIWVGVRGYGIYRIDEASGIIKEVTPKEFHLHNITGIRLLDDNNIQVSCPNYIIDMSLTSDRLILTKKEWRRGDSHFKVPGMTIKDAFGNLWTGTNGSGVLLRGYRRNPFRQILDKPVWCILLDNDGVWAGGRDTLYWLDKKMRVRVMPFLYNKVKGNILAISKNGEDILMAAGGKLFAYNVVSYRIREITCNGKAVNALTFYYDNRSNVTWITAWDGIYSISNGKIKKENKLNRILNHQQCNGLRVDDQGKFWVGTIDEGLFLFDKYQNLIRHYIQQNGFFSNSIMHLRFGYADRLWLATPDGIGLFNTHDPKSPSYYGFKQGLTDPFICAVADAPNGNAWVTTNNGLSYLDMRHNAFMNFNGYDGVPEYNFNGGLLLLPNSMLMFTTMGGLYVADTLQLLNPGKMSQVSFTSCMVRQANADQISMKPVMPDNSNTYKLAYYENEIVVSFAVGDKMQCPRTDYSYRIRELSDDWTLTDVNTISFMGLSPGKDTIEIRARLHGQSWDNASYASMRLLIAHPWWSSWMAKLAYALLFILLLVLVLLRYQRRLTEKNKLILERQSIVAEKENNRERLQFFTNIAHELRTPLTLIFGPIEQLEQSLSLGMEERQSVGLLRNNANRLLSLINQLMDFRKAETHHKKLKIQQGSLQELVENVGREFEQANRNPNIVYKVEIGTAASKIWFDGEVLTTILNNLLSNATKNTLRGEVVISLDEISEGGKNYSRISVADTGSGISEQDLPHIFDRYYQGAQASRSSGTGIGLALVKALCELHMIKISVNSKVGKGTVFVLIIDNAETYPEAEIVEHKTVVGQSQAITSHKTSDQPTILVVEDNTDINNYIAQNLSKDYIVIQASNGEEGLKAAKISIPDLIICDIMMPVMDGLTMTRLTKSDMSTSHIPVIMLTAKTTMDDRQEGYESSADSYLTKPFSITMLKVRVRNLLESRRNLAKHILAAASSTDPGYTSSNGSKTNESKTFGDSISRLSRLDSQFMVKLNGIITAHIADPKLNLAGIASELGISQSTLYRKAKALTGFNTNEYIRKLRLENARRLMAEEGRNVSQAAYESGFADLAYFRQVFRQEYGDTPNNYLRGK